MTLTPRLLDLFCGVGGCSVGYAPAGFTVTGVDRVRRLDYPFPLEVRDALAFLRGIEPDDYDVIHASPPCKVHTVLAAAAARSRPTLFDAHTDLVAETRELLIATGLPYVIENVPGAPLIAPVTVCGSAFGLGVRRHRLFETNVPGVSGTKCDHAAQGVQL